MIPVALPTKVLVFPEDVDVSQIPRRAYDFNKGDRRFFDQQEAIDHAHSLASKTGVRQIVRQDVDVLGRHPYLVQAIGS